VYEPTYASPSAATRLFNLPGYRVVDVEVDEVGRRTVLAETVDPVAGCPSCGLCPGGCISELGSGCATSRSPVR
jgi:hypothetical protein